MRRAIVPGLAFAAAMAAWLAPRDTGPDDGPRPPVAAAAPDATASVRPVAAASMSADPMARLATARTSAFAAWRTALKARTQEKYAVLAHRAATSRHPADIAAALLTRHDCAPYRRIAPPQTLQALDADKRAALAALTERCDTQGQDKTLRDQLRALIERLPVGDEASLLRLLDRGARTDEEQRLGLRLAAASGSADMLAAVMGRGIEHPATLAQGAGLVPPPLQTGWMDISYEALPRMLRDRIPAERFKAWSRSDEFAEGERNSGRMLDDALLLMALEIAACSERDDCARTALQNPHCIATRDCVDDLRQWPTRQLFDPDSRALLPRVYPGLTPEQRRARWAQIERWIAALLASGAPLTAP